MTVGAPVALTVATEGPLFPATPAIGQTQTFAAGEIVTATALPVRAWSYDAAQRLIASTETPAGGWLLTDAGGRVLDLGVGGTATFAMPAVPATLTWAAEAVDPALWRTLAFDDYTMLCREGERFVLPAPNPKPGQGLVVTGVWVAEDGTRLRAGDAYGPVTENVTFTAERLPWAEAHFGGGDYDPEADPDGDGYANAEEALDLTDPNDPASHPTPPALTLLSNPPVQTPCADWAGRCARFGGVDAESAVTLLAQIRLPGGDWGALIRTAESMPHITPLGPQTEYRVGVADALGAAFLDGLPGGHADHVVWSDVFTLECTDPRPRLVATLAVGGTLTLRNVGKEPLETKVIPAVFRTEAKQTWKVENGTVTADAPFTWELPWMNGLPDGPTITFTYTYNGDNLFFTPSVQVMNRETKLVDTFVDSRWDNVDVETADIELDVPYPTATALQFSPMVDFDGKIELYTVNSVTLYGHDVWTSATLDEATPIDLAPTVKTNDTWTRTFSFGPAIPSAERAIFIRSNDPVEPRLFLHWPRLGYRLRLR